MSDRTILITGCSSGIGYHAAHTLTERGYRVFASARKTDDVARLTAEGLETLQLDLQDPTSMHLALEQLLDRTGGQLYGLFNNAGYGQPGAVEDLSREALREQFETNVFGTLDLTNRVIPVMRQQGEGRIVVNSSVLGLVAMAFRGAYIASKFALEGLFDTLRLELADTDIRVSLIEPGPITSDFRSNAFGMYEKHINRETSPFRETYAAMERRLHKPGPAAPFTLGPEAVTAQLIKALESPRPKAHYHVTFPTSLFAGLRRLLPTSTLDRILREVSTRENH